MYIQRLELESFRCFKHLSLNFSSNCNLLIADNGGGKTSVTDSIAYLLACINGHLNENLAGYNKSSNIYKLWFEKTVESENQASIKIETVLNEKKLKWGLVLHNNIDGIYYTNEEEEKQLRTEISTYYYADKKAILPVFAHYPTKRTAPTTSYVSKEEYNTNGGRVLGWKDALDFEKSIDIQQISKRVKTLQLTEYETKETPTELTAIKNAIKKCIPNCEEIIFRSDWQELYLKFSDGEWKPFSMLSEGYRNMLAVVADIAYRCGRLNPYAKDVLAETNGVVIIDEIDLHLHPTWQEKIVDNLTNTFPKIQFILSTHSPIICRGLKMTDKILRLNKGEVEEISGTDKTRLIKGNILEAYETGTFGEKVSVPESTRKQRNRLGELNIKSIHGKITEAEEKELFDLRRIYPTKYDTVTE